MKKLALFLFALSTIFTCNKISAYSVEMDPSTPLTDYTSFGEWNTDGNLDGWSYNDNLSSVSVSAGSFKGTATGNDPIMDVTTPTFYVQSGSVFELRIKLNATPSSTIIESFVRIDGGGSIAPGMRFLNGAAPTDNQFHTYRITLDSGDSLYFGNLTSIRLDPMSAAGDNCEIDYFRASDPTGGMERVQVHGHVLETVSGKPFFPIADTVWLIANRLNRDDVITYLDTRKSQHFNTINMTAFINEGTEANQYGDQPFEIVSGKYDPLQPITTTGSDPANATEYDFWDHVDFIINSAKDRGIYVVLLPAWGARIAGDWGSGVPNGDVILNTSNAKSYATWIATRYKNFDNIIWMIGGDRSAVYGSYDYRPAFREMAAGVLAGNPNRPLLQSYHPKKYAPNSSEWFHNDDWLSFNSCEDQPSDQLTAINHDFALSPVKPTWLFEGGYEERSTSDGTYGSWQVRFQAYQTVFAGAFGHSYGHMSLWEFKSDWKTKINDTGANDMQHLRNLMESLSPSHFFSLVPDQALISGDTGSMTGAEGMFSSCIVAIHSAGNGVALIYSANGRNITVIMSRLISEPMRARWFNPRDGTYTTISTNVPSGVGAPNKTFDPPGDTVNGNDYVLVLDLGDVEPPPGPDVGTGNTAYWRFEEGTDGVAHSGHDDNWYKDSSGGNDDLSAWGTDNNPEATSDRPFTVVPQTSAANSLALKCTGGQCISTADGDALNSYTFPNGFTVECMVKYNNNDINVAVCKDGQPNTTYGDPNFCIKRRGTDALQFEFYDGTGNKHDLRSSTGLSSDIWYRVAAVCDGANARLYVQQPGGSYALVAEETGTVSGSALYSDNQKWVVGRGMWSSANANYLNGFVDEVRITNVALSVSSFLGTEPSADPGQAAYWKLDEGTTGSAHSGHDDNFYTDHTGNGNNMSAWGSEVNPTATSDRPFTTVPRTLAPNPLAMSFTGTESISTASGAAINSYNFADAFTIECMVKYNDYSTRVAICKDATPTADNSPLFCIKHRVDTGVLEFDFIDGNGTRHDLQTSFISNTGIWYRVAAVCDGSEGRLYVRTDSTEYQLVGTTTGVTGGALYDYEAKWVIGRGIWNGSPTDYLNGYVDEVRITNVALSTTLFLGAVPEPSLIIGLIALIGMMKIRATPPL